MAQPHWKFYLADSDDLTVNSEITNNSHDKQLVVSHNRSGSFSFNINLNTENLDYTQTNEKCVICIKNEVIVWSGPIWTRDIDLANEKINCTAVGWFEILMNRYFTGSVPDYSTGTTNEGTIALALLAYANAQTDTWINVGSNSADSLRTIKYEQFQSIGEEIINLSDMEDGFDMKVDPVSRDLDIFNWDEFTDRTSIPFGHNWGVNNISDLVIQENGGEMRNDIFVVGNNNYVAHSSAASSIASKNMLQEVYHVTELSNETTIDAIANAEVAVKQNPLITYDITLKPSGQGNPYEIFEDYDIGDKIYFTAHKELESASGEINHIVISGEPRIFGATISIDDNEIERVSSLRTTYTGT